MLTKGKGRCDLLPLGVIGEQTNDNILSLVEAYIRNGVPEVLWEAICIFSKRHYNETFTALLEASKQYEDGARSTATAIGKKAYHYIATLTAVFRPLPQSSFVATRTSRTTELLFGICSVRYGHIKTSLS